MLEHMYQQYGEMSWHAEGGDAWDLTRPKAYVPAANYRCRSVDDRLLLDWQVEHVASGPWQSSGPIGPRFRDAMVLQRLREGLAAQDDLDVSCIRVDIWQGEVVLEGTVPTRAARTLVTEVAEATDGVAAVHDRLQIQGPSETTVLG